MSKADKMFEELGYHRDDDGRYPTYYKGDITLMFDIDDKQYSLSEWVDVRNRRLSVHVGVDLNKAIHEKMKELGWI